MLICLLQSVRSYVNEICYLIRPPITPPPTHIYFIMYPCYTREWSSIVIYEILWSSDEDLVSHLHAIGDKSVLGEL